MNEKCIFHIDVNSAYLSWEAVYRQKYLGEPGDLRQQVAVVGGDEKLRRGIVLAKSIPAGKYGIKTGQSLLEARQKYPGLTIVPPDYDLYERCSAALMALLSRYSPCVEQYSIDEAFVDMTEVLPLWQSIDGAGNFNGVETVGGGAPAGGCAVPPGTSTAPPGASAEPSANAAPSGVSSPPPANPGLHTAKNAALTAAEHIRAHISRELGFTVNIGISTNKVLAKMASDFQKPDRIHTLYPHEIPYKMWPLPVGELFFVGRATKNKLEKLGIRTIGELAATDAALLHYHFKKHGTVIRAFANGLDASVVMDTPQPAKGYGNSTTIAMDVDNEAAARLVLLKLAETLAARLRQDHVQIQVVAVGIKTSTFEFYSHQMVLENPTNITNEIYQYACRLFGQCWRGEPIRHLGIHTGQVSDFDRMRQLHMFDTTDYDKLAKMDAAVDEIRQRYGRNAILRAALLGGHMKNAKRD